MAARVAVLPEGDDDARAYAAAVGRLLALGARYGRR